ncbi:hypothetical protein EXIGLDRAFT_736619 [Exidia glandulosa HHB12029]|uniref:GAR domain-containing protein n=1 Tax=Exidia glandulosa HHB12029 TaxID=1314781 RepID=A0A165JB26_EXIGL|nr:hypothetical protein EXIGLDRAFT_736619 [Exidia glandulosa HHB12029]
MSSTSTLSVVANGTQLGDSPKALSAASSSTASLRKSLNGDDEDNTLTGKRLTLKAKRNSQEDLSSDLRLLAVSAQITEISYSISDIQTRIFEIQELRHRSLDEDKSGSTSSNSTGVIDQALINLDERLEAVSASIAAVDEALGVTPGETAKPPENAADQLLLRKHGALIEEWEAVQNEAETLRDELKEDKWLAVFRTVSEQAEGMMSSLEKGVTQCHDFIWLVQRRNTEDHQSTVSSGTSLLSDRSPINYETFTTLLQSFESKKKYYMPSITKVLSVLDKGVRDRVTKNGECLRRHADLRARWHNLRERIGRIDQEMEGVRRMLVNRDMEPSEGSTTSRVTSKSRNGFLSTSASRSPSATRTASSSKTSTATLNRSISPFSNIRKFATKVSDKISGRQTPSALLTPPSSTGSVRSPPSEPSSANRKSTFFPFRSSAATPTPVPETPPRTKHGHSQSLQNSPASAQRPPSSAGKPAKGRWNSSTKIEDEPAGTIKTPPLRKRPSATNMGGSYFRSPSPGSAAFPPISRPITPSAASSYKAPSTSGRTSSSRPASRSGSVSHTKTTSTSSPPRSHTPSVPQRAQTPGGTLIARVQTPGGSMIMPRPRPQSPSHIPAPKNLTSRGSDGNASSDEDYEGMPTSLMQRAFSPAFSLSATSAVSTPGGDGGRPRTPSSSRIPGPSLNVPGSTSRPGSAIGRATPNLLRSQTPEHLLRQRAGQMPFYQGTGATTPNRPTPRPSFSSSVAGPPSSFKESSTPERAPSRPASRSGLFTPSLDQNPVPSYVPCRTDPLDVEVAKCVNGFPHGFLVERIDPPLRVPPRAGEEVRAQYAVSNALARKIITCRLVVINRPKATANADGDARKVMCRVGGGWLDLQMYLLNRQAGMS